MNEFLREVDGKLFEEAWKKGGKTKEVINLEVILKDIEEGNEEKLILDSKTPMMVNDGFIVQDGIINPNTINFKKLSLEGKRVDLLEQEELKLIEKHKDFDKDSTLEWYLCWHEIAEYKLKKQVWEDNICSFNELIEINRRIREDTFDITIEKQSKIPKPKTVKIIPKYTTTSPITALQQALNNEPMIWGKTELVFNNIEFETLKEKVIILSEVYSFFYYSSQGIKSIRLIDLMENIGYQKKKDRNTTKGFTYFDKEEALEGVRKARDIELAIRADTKDEVEYYKRIFPEFRAGEFFATQFFEIKTYKHFTRKFKLKDAYIEFTPFYNPKELKYQLNDRNKKVFEIPNNQIEAKVLALYFLNTLAVNRKNKMEAYSFKVEKLLQIAGIKSDRKYESRVRKKLANSLRYLKNEGIIEDYTLPPRNKGWNSYEKFLSSEVKIEFFN